jgi:putative flippase GtrA
MVRWQLSTPTLAVFSALTVAYLRHVPLQWPTWEEWVGAAVANVIGSLIFFWVDRWIFNRKKSVQNGADLDLTCN